MGGTIAGQATGNIPNKFPNKLPNKLWMQHPVISNTCWEVYLHIKTDSHTTTDTMNIYVNKIIVAGKHRLKSKENEGSSFLQTHHSSDNGAT